MSDKPKLLLPSNPTNRDWYGDQPSYFTPDNPQDILSSQEISAMSRSSHPQKMNRREKRHIRLISANGSPVKKTLSRYAAILLDQEGNRHIAKVITTLSMDEWAEKHGYIAERWFRISGEIDTDKEKTEIA